MVVSCMASPSLLMFPSVLVHLPFLAHCQYSLLISVGHCLDLFSVVLWQNPDTGESCCAKSSQAQKGKKPHLSSVAGSFTVIHCAAAELTALCWLFNCCRQKADQSVLGVCFIVVILRRQTHRQGTLTQRQTDEGNFCCARWGCAIQHWEELRTRKTIIHHRIRIFHMIKVCQVSARHKYPQTYHHLNFVSLFCPRSYHFTPEYSLELKHVISLTEAWRKTSQDFGSCEPYLLFFQEISAD